LVLNLPISKQAGIKALRPDYKPLTIHVLGVRIEEWHNIIQNRVQETIASAKYVAIALDSWEDHQRMPVLAFTVHLPGFCVIRSGCVISSREGHRALLYQFSWGVSCPLFLPPKLASSVFFLLLILPLTTAPVSLSKNSPRRFSSR